MNATLQLSRSVKLGRRQSAPPDLRFHRQMAWGTAVTLAVSVAGCALTSIHTAAVPRAIAVLTVLAMALPIPAYWHHRQRWAMRDAALTIPWAILMAATLSFPLLIAARLRMPLQDAVFARVDGMIGVNIASLSAWAQHHAAGHVINWTYPLLTPLLAAAIFVPAFSGRVRSAKELLLANLIAFTIAVPLFAMLPAVGPWYHFHTTPTSGQAYCQVQLLSLRFAAPYVYTSQGAGIVCFPSFHVIWTILCARALWGFTALRIPVCLLSSLIILSTMTTGWHYASDVIAGGAIAVCAAMLAARLTHKGTGS